MLHPEGWATETGIGTKLRAAHGRHKSEWEKVEGSEQVASLTWGRGEARRGLEEGGLLKPVAAKRKMTPPEVWIPGGLHLEVSMAVVKKRTTR